MSQSESRKSEIIEIGLWALEREMSAGGIGGMNWHSTFFFFPFLSAMTSILSMSGHCLEHETLVHADAGSGRREPFFTSMCCFVVLSVRHWCVCVWIEKRNEKKYKSAAVFFAECPAFLLSAFSFFCLQTSGHLLPPSIISTSNKYPHPQPWHSLSLSLSISPLSLPSHK